MLKKLRNVFILSLSLIMMLSTTAFAAEDNGDNNLNIYMEDVEYDGMIARAPAAAVSSVRIVDSEAYIDNNGDVIIPVYIVGYGHNEIATWDGVRATYVSQTLYSGTDRVVYAFKQYWNCGHAEVGVHRFNFSTTSINSPWNTMSATAQFRIE